MNEPTDETDPRRIPHPSADLPDILPRVLDGALRQAGLDTSDPKISRAVEVTMMVASGPLPLPPPDILQEYEDRFPGLVDRFISWTEEQRRHRFAIERRRTDREERRLDRAQLITTLIAMTGLIASAIVGVWGSAIVASILAIVSIGGPTAAVWLARGRSSNDEPKSIPDDKDRED